MDERLGDCEIEGAIRRDVGRARKGLRRPEDDRRRRRREGRDGCRGGEAAVGPGGGGEVGGKSEEDGLWLEGVFAGDHVGERGILPLCFVRLERPGRDRVVEEEETHPVAEGSLGLEAALNARTGRRGVAPEVATYDRARLRLLDRMDNKRLAAKDPLAQCSLVRRVEQVGWEWVPVIGKARHVKEVEVVGARLHQESNLGGERLLL